MNDNPPTFTQRHYTAKIEETISVTSPSPIVQLLAQDKDQTSVLKYSIVSGNVGGMVSIESCKTF